MPNYLKVLNDTQKAYLDAIATVTETALPQVLSGLPAGSTHIMRYNILSGTVLTSVTAPSFITYSATAGNSALTTMNNPAHVAGDILYLRLGFRSDQTPPNLDAQGWTQVGTSRTTGFDSTSHREIARYWKRATSAAEAAPTWSIAVSPIMSDISVIRGCKATDTPVVEIGSGVNTGGAIDVTFPGGTVPSDQSLIVAGMITNQAINLGDALPTLIVNTDLTSITDRFGNFNSGQSMGVYLQTGVKVAAGSMVSSTATLAFSTAAGLYHDAFLAV